MMALMTLTSPAARGRPRSITFARIADAAIGIGLPAITFTGVAAALGVSHMALYKHVPGLDALKHLVAEEIFRRWEIPPVAGGDGCGLAAYLGQFVASLRALVKANPGLAPYLLRRSAATGAMLDKISQHHLEVARGYALSHDAARWLLTTIAFHCIAVADTVYAVSADDHPEQAELEREFGTGMQALIVGALASIGERPGADAAQDNGR